MGSGVISEGIFARVTVNEFQEIFVGGHHPSVEFAQSNLKEL